MSRIQKRIMVTQKITNKPCFPTHISCKPQPQLTRYLFIIPKEKMVYLPVLLAHNANPGTNKSLRGLLQPGSSDFYHFDAFQIHYLIRSIHYVEIVVQPTWSVLDQGRLPCIIMFPTRYLPAQLLIYQYHLF